MHNSTYHNSSVYKMFCRMWQSLLQPITLESATIQSANSDKKFADRPTCIQHVAAESILGHDAPCLRRRRETLTRRFSRKSTEPRPITLTHKKIFAFGSRKTLIAVSRCCFDFAWSLYSFMSRLSSFVAWFTF